MEQLHLLLCIYFVKKSRTTSSPRLTTTLLHTALSSAATRSIIPFVSSTAT